MRKGAAGIKCRAPQIISMASSALSLSVVFIRVTPSIRSWSGCGLALAWHGQAVEQVTRWHGERVGEDRRHGEMRVALPLLQRADVCAVNLGPRGERFLREPAPLSHGA